MAVARDARSATTVPTSMQPKRSAFRADIQGLRAVAVGAVILYHAGLPVPGGYVGVDVFFVISGFLITAHLLAEISATGRLDFGRFYARRARRILPASFVVLVATLAASTIMLPPVLVRGVAEDAVASALYVPNVLFAWRGTDYLAETAPSPFQHYWSLGVEEQFYLVWPLVLVGAWLLLRHSTRRLAVLVGFLVAASLVAGWFVTYSSPSWAFFSLPTRAGELGAGALVAIAGPAAANGFSRRWAAAMGWCGLGLVLVSIVRFNEFTPFPGTAVLLPVTGTAAVIFFGQRSGRAGPEGLLKLGAFQFVGAISYSLYLVHWPLMVLPTFVRGRIVDLSLTTGLVLIVVSILLAWALYKWVENPMRVLPSLVRRPSRVTLLWALGASLVGISLAVGAVALTASRPLSTDRVTTTIDPVTTATIGPVTTATINVTNYPAFTDFVPANLTPSLDAASGDVPRIYSDGCHLPESETAPPSCVFGDPTSTTDVVLFGDSHAAQWFPPLEKLAIDFGFRLTVFTKSSCPSVDIDVFVDAVPYDQCASWRGNVIARIQEMEPEVVVLSNLADYGSQIPGATDAAWADGLASVLRKLPAASRVAILADTPTFGETPAVCLSANLESASYCSSPRDVALRPARSAAERRVAEDAGASYFDFNDSICDEDTCGVIIAATLVYRDGHHLTATFARDLAPEIWDKIEPLLVARSSQAEAP